MKNNSSFWQVYRLPLLLLACLLPTLINVFRFSRHIGAWWPSVHYFVGYETGFGGRKLMGTLCGWLFPSYVQGWMVSTLVLTSNLLMLLLFVLLICMTVRRISSATLPVCMALLVYGLNPFSILQYCNRGLSSGFMETYQLLLVLAWLPLFLRCRRRWYYYLATLVVAVVGCLIHHTFCCTLFPLMVALFVYDLFVERFPVDRTVAYGAVCLLMAGLFLAIWFHSTMTVDIDTLQQRIIARADSDACGAYKEALRQYYYAAYENNVQNLQLLRLVEFVFTLVLMAPVFVIAYFPWLQAAKRSGQSMYWIVPAVLTLLTLPVFFRTTDYSRWWTCWFFCLTALSLVAFGKGDKPVIDALDELWCFFKRRWYLGVILLVYLAQLFQSGYEGLTHAVVLREFLFGATPFDIIKL